MRSQSLAISPTWAAGVGVALLVLSACRPAVVRLAGEMSTSTVSRVAQSSPPTATGLATASPLPTVTSAPEWSDTLTMNLLPGDYIGILQLAEPATSAWRPSVLSLLAVDGRIVGTLATTYIDHARVSPSGDRIAFNIPGTGGLRIHNFLTGETINFLTEHFVLSPSWSPDEAFILALVDDAIATIDPSTGRINASVTCHTLLNLEQPACASPSISADGKWIAVNYLEGNNAPAEPGPDGIYVFPTDCVVSAACSRSPRMVPMRGVLAFAWAPSGDDIAVGESYVFDVSNWVVAKKLAQPGFTTSVAWSPDGEYIASTDGYSLKLIDLRTGSKREVYETENDMRLVFWATMGR